MEVDEEVEALKKNLTKFYKETPATNDTKVADLYRKLRKSMPEMIMALSMGPHNIIEAEREWVVDLPVKIFGLDGKYTG